MAVVRFIQKQVDALIYGLVGPFAMLYVFPQFFLGLERKLGIAFTASHLQDVVGTTLMWLGAFLALWCGLILMTHRGGTVSAFSSPKKIVMKGPYKIVRHPMMWAIHIVLTGEILVFSSPILALWFLVWLRIAALYVCRYEEPKLVELFGDEYAEYCKRTPRWMPFSI